MNMFRRWIIPLVLLVSFALFFSKPLYAKNDTSSVNMLIPSICKLTIEKSDQTLNLAKDASGESAYEKGFIDGKQNTPMLIVDSNTGWKLSVRVSSDWNMVGSYKKPTSDIKLEVNSDTGHQTGFMDFPPLSLSDQEIASYRGGVGDDVYKCRYRILLDWGRDIPGSYSIVVVYTLTTQLR